MRLNLLLSFILFSIASISDAQIGNNNSRFDDESNTLVEFEGSFSYSVNNTNYLIELSISGGSYIEYNESGTVLSNGSFERIGDVSYRLTPSKIFSGAKIKDEIKFKSISISSRDINIEIYNSSSGESAGTLMISKVQ